MIWQWKYQALTSSGLEVSGSFLGSRKALLDMFANLGLEVISFEVDWRYMCSQYLKAKTMPIKASAIFFEDLYNMQKTGMSMDQMLNSMIDSAGHQGLKIAAEQIRANVQQGSSLADAFNITGVFPWIVTVALNSGEKSGHLEGSFKMLAEYFKKKELLRGRLKEAMVYPAVVLVLLIGLLFYVGLGAIPKLNALLPESAAGNPGTFIITGFCVCLKRHALMVIALLVAVAGVVVTLISKDKLLAQRIFYEIPIVGKIQKETDLAFYFLNLSVLLNSGVPLMQSIDDLHVLDQGIVSNHFFSCREYLFGGLPLWESLKTNSFFPTVTVFTVRRGEEMGKLPVYCQNIAEYFHQRVQERVEVAVTLIQPALLAFGGIFLIIIAFAFLVPVYGSLNQIAGG